MRPRLTFTITSVLTILLFTVHWADDVARGIDKGGAGAFWALVVLGVWLHAAVILAARAVGPAAIAGSAERVIEKSEPPQDRSPREAPPRVLQ